VAVANKVNFAILGVGVAVIIALALFPQFASRASTRTLIEFFEYLALAEFWNLMLGYAGLISVGQQAYIGIGAYSLWVFSDKVGINPFIAVVIAAVVGGIIALPAASLLFKLRGGYLAIGTWVLAEVCRLFVANLPSAGGGSGVSINSVAAPDMTATVRTDGSYYWAVALAVIAIGVTYVLLRSRTGLALKSMRDNDLAAQSNGVNLWRTKLFVYIIAGAGCAAVGAIVGMSQINIEPTSMFDINWSAYLIFIAVIGGIGTIEGPIIGTIIFYVLQQYTAQYGTWYFIGLGAVAIVVTIWSPRGIYGWIARLTNFYLFPLQRKVKVIEEAGSPVEPPPMDTVEPA
jgi:branched-chain amino acid transport system permease protein